MLHLHAEMLQDAATGVWEGKLVASIEGMATGVVLASFEENVLLNLCANVMHHGA